jgi:hypothetical protein
VDRVDARQPERDRQLAPGKLEKVWRELATYQQFAALTEQVVEANKAICEARPAAAPATGCPPGQQEPDGEKGALGTVGLAAVELAICTAMTSLGTRLLEDLLALDTGYGGPAISCAAGYQARFVSERDKVTATVLGPAPTTAAASAQAASCPATRSWEQRTRRRHRGCARWLPCRDRGLIRQRVLSRPDTHHPGCLVAEMILVTY